MSEFEARVIDERSYDDAFPQVDCAVSPLGQRIIVQLRKAKSKTKGGIIMVSETKATEKYNEVVAKVVKLGPLAYKNLMNLEPLPEGNWCEIGDLVRVIRYGGDRWSVQHEDDWVHFIILNADEVICKIDSYDAAKAMYAFVE